MTVTNSKNPSVIGVGGIVVKETVRCLIVINSKNEIKNLLKQGSVFEVEVDDYDFNIRIWGDNIIY